MRVCNKCGVEKPIDEFGLLKKDYYRKYCKVCQYKQDKIRIYNKKHGIKPEIIIKTTKICMICLEEKSLDEFYNRGKNRKDSYCKLCKNDKIIDLQNRYKQEGRCIICGKNSNNKRWCAECVIKLNNRRRNKTKKIKEQCVKYLGGECEDCGMKTEVYEIYDFHHINQNEKETKLSNMIHGLKSWEYIKGELDKCIVLCANCHRIRHTIEE